MSNDNDVYFEDGLVFKWKEGTTITIESESYKLERDIYERHVPELFQRNAVFQEKRLSDGADVVVKLHFQ